MRTIAIVLFALFLASCGGSDPAAPDYRNDGVSRWTPPRPESEETLLQAQAEWDQEQAVLDSQITTAY